MNAVEPNYLAGDSLSIVSSFFWAFAVICFRKAGTRLDSLEQNIFKNSVSAILFSLTLPVLGIPFAVPDVTANEWALLCLSGIIGMTFADILFFKSLKILGATLSAIVSSLYSPFMIILCWIFLGESVDFWLFAGMALVMAGIVVGTWEHSILEFEGGEGNERGMGYLVLGLFLAVLFVVLVVVSVVMIKRILEERNALWVCWVRLVSGAAGMFLVYPLLSGEYFPKRMWRMDRSTGWMLMGSFIGTWLGYALWLWGMKFIPASRASVLNELYLIWIFLLSALILKESLTLQRGFAVLVSFVGVSLTLGAAKWL